MYKKLFACVLLSLFSSYGYAQQMLWANKMLEVSSERTDAQYSPKNRGIQILGKPSVYPQMVASDCAWQPGGSDFGEDYIKVAFEQPIHVQQIAIIENVNPGAVARIFGYDLQNNEYLLYQSDGNKIGLKSRFWRIFIDSPPAEKLNALKILVHHPLAKGIKQYDAIGISDSKNFIQAEINLAEDIPQNLEKKNLGTMVNSPYGELAPIITPDGRTIYFTRSNHPENIPSQEKNAPPAQDIWFSKLNKDGSWAKAEHLGPPVNNAFDNAAATASADAKSLYILNEYLPNGKPISGLSKTTILGKNWSKPAKVQIEGFMAKGQYNPITKENEIRTEYAISHDETVLIMGLQHIKTYGGKDLYISFKQPDGSFSLPKNLGNVINTADNEGSPFLSADKKTLYFNSKGHPGYGDADIYMSRSLDDSWTNWSEPKNLGPKINSATWDGYFSIPASGDYAYLSSKDEAIGGEDIFRIALFPSIQPEIMVVLNGQIIDKETKKPLVVPFSLYFQNKEQKPDSIAIKPDSETATFSVILPRGVVYKAFIKQRGYLELTDQIALTSEKVEKTIEKNFELMPLREGNSMILQNLFFDQGKYEIKSSSYEEMARIISIMKEYPTMRVLLEGFTDNQGDFDLNVKLAADRVNAVKHYLVEIGGIATDRIETKSWGPMKPISSNAMPEMREKNRRVEFTILKM